MQLLEVSGAVLPIYGSLGVKRLVFLGFYFALPVKVSQFMCAMYYPLPTDMQR